MTEAEWLVAVNAQKMIAVLSGKGSERLWRLFAVACVRQADHLMRDKRSRHALAVAARYADGRATLEELRVARVWAEEAAQQAGYDAYMDEVRANFCWDAGYEAAWEAKEAAEAAVDCVAEDFVERPPVIGERWQLADLLREIFGNPFRWTLIDPVWLSWNDGIVVRMASAIYNEKAFGRLLILADALENAGCNDGPLLDHLRSPGPHVQGCWGLDALLGKG